MPDKQTQHGVKSPKPERQSHDLGAKKGVSHGGSDRTKTLKKLQNFPSFSSHKDFDPCSGVERRHEAKPLRVKSPQAEPATVIMAILPRRLTRLRVRSPKSL